MFCVITEGLKAQHKDSLLSIKIASLLSFSDAASDLEKVSNKTGVKFIFNNEKYKKINLNFDYFDVTLGEFLTDFCRRTRSQYLIGSGNRIYIWGKYDKIKPDMFSDNQSIPTFKLPRIRNNVLPVKNNFELIGKITDIETGESLPGVTIMVQGTKIMNSSNVDGLFTLYNVPNDTAIINFSTIGYQPYELYLEPGTSMENIKISMTPIRSMMSEVIVTANKKQSFVINQKPGLVKLSPSLIQSLPSIGEKDVFRAFQLMPGVSAANENTSGLYVRGGTPDQNLVLLDGFTMYNVEHMFGFFSAFNGNAIKDISLYKSGFDAKYGGRLSSLIDINGKEGGTKQFNAGLDLTMLSFNTFAEGKISKKITGIFNLRRSFKTALYDKLYQKFGRTSSTNPSRGLFGRNRMNESSQQTQSFFFDLNTKLTWKPTEKDVLSLSIYNGKDNLDNSFSPRIPGFLQGTGRAFGLDVKDITAWGNTGSSLKWSRKWTSKFYSNTLLSYSSYFSERDRTSSDSRPDSSGNLVVSRRGTLEDNFLQDVNIKSDLEYKIKGNHSIEAGVQSTWNSIDYSYAQNDTSKIIDRKTNGITAAAYLQGKFFAINKRIQISPGIRSTWFQPTNKFYYEPRINATYEFIDNWKLKTSAGRYYQFVKRVTREDVLQSSRDFWALADGSKLPVSYSDQKMIGLAWENEDLLIDVEFYQKIMQGLSEYSLRFNFDQRNLTFSENYFQGKGIANGMDFLIQKKFGDYTGWIAYTLGQVKNTFPDYSSESFYASNDVRHEFKTVHTYKWKGFEFSGTFILATGKPYTAPAGGYTLTMLDGTTKSFINVSDKNANRLPSYHRLDLAATYNFDRIFGGKGSLSLSVFNVYNRSNIWYKNYEVISNTVVGNNVYYLGVTPNLSFSYRLK